MPQMNLKVPSNADPHGIFEVRPLSEESASKTAELVKKNHENYHIYIHDVGVHNHILHHLLVLYSLGATPVQLEKAYRHGTPSQRASAVPNVQQVHGFQDPAQFHACLGQGKYYNDYFAFFQKEIDTNGVAKTFDEFLFKGDERAEEMFRRFFGGYVHSPIHLGYAIEFDQPVIAAEALALTAIHDSAYGEALTMVEQFAQSSPSLPKASSLIDIQETLSSHKRIQSVLRYDPFKQLDHILANAKDDLLQVLSQWQVQPDELEIKTAELLNTWTYLTTLAQRPDKQLRIDFFLMHRQLLRTRPRQHTMD